MELIKRCWAEVDLDQMERNYYALREKINPETLMMGVVKADAYGHGAVRCARLLAELGINWFGVSNISEALQLRRAVETCLTDQERQVIVLRYGLNGGPPQRQREVAQVTGVSRSYISRIEKRALEKLRSALE